jgi:hypothetical protein
LENEEDDRIACQTAIAIAIEKEGALRSSLCVMSALTASSMGSSMGEGARARQQFWRQAQKKGRVCVHVHSLTSPQIALAHKYQPLHPGACDTLAPGRA